MSLGAESLDEASSVGASVGACVGASVGSSVGSLVGVSDCVSSLDDEAPPLEGLPSTVMPHRRPLLLGRQPFWHCTHERQTGA